MHPYVTISEQFFEEGMKIELTTAKSGVLFKTPKNMLD